LRIQNKNLSERLVQRQKLEADLKEKIEHLQNRKASDDSKLCIVDRYWTQLDEDLRFILERFDCNTSIELLDSDGSSVTSSNSGTNKIISVNKENQSSNQSLRNFLAKLKEWDKVDLEENLKERVKFTTQTVSKLVSNYDR
jgi:E3 ubiquitin-protein ligase BRE1